jgi:hypothetical protein
MIDISSDDSTSIQGRRRHVFIKPRQWLHPTCGGANLPLDGENCSYECPVVFKLWSGEPTLPSTDYSIRSRAEFAESKS